MARNQFEDALRAVLTGGLQGYQAGRAGQQDLEKTLMLERIKKSLSPEDTSLKEAQAQYYRSRAQNPLAGYLEESGIPSGYEKGYDKQGRPILVKSNIEKEKSDKLNRATILRKEFNADQAYKNYQIINRSVEGLENAYKLATSPNTKSRIASDQVLGVLFQKMLDPQSVVRESEYARTPEGAAFLSRVEALAPQLAKGGLRLKNEDRMALVEAGRKLLESSQDTFNTHIERYAQLAKDYEVEPKLIFGNITKIKKSSPVSQYVRMGTNSKGQRVGQLPDGTIEVIK